ncbi:MAG: zinc ribbon domain-containing protein [Armatimonadota bacterium]|nr:MAG: zinc ribbon domain-containing protein [Armatimonadota bacterium]
MRCPRCDAEIPPDAKLCPQCLEAIEPPGNPGAEDASAQPAPLAPPWPPPAGIIGRLGLIERLLKYRARVIEDIREDRSLGRYVADAFLVTVVCSVFYGFVVGVSVGGWQTLYDPLKFPWILVFTLLLCLPTLYVFSAYLGSALSLAQVAVVAFGATAMVSIILLAFAPVTWFFMFTAPGSHHFAVLLNVAVFAAAGAFGVGFLMRAMQALHAETAELGKMRRFVGWWVALYAVVGAQMAWLLRPYFNVTDVFIRPRGGNFFVAVLKTIAESLSGQGW